MTTRLLVVTGPDRGLIIPLPADGRVRLGRGREIPIPLTDPYVSRSHCEVLAESGAVVVVDPESAGGTFVNNQRVTRQPLTPEDLLQIGETTIRLQNETLADQATLAPPLAEIVPEPPAPQKQTAARKPSRKAVALPADRLAELAGTTLSHFDIGPLVGRGQSGLVFHARDRNNGRVVALKVFWAEFSGNEQEIQRFIRAMKTVLPIRHPNIVTLWAAGKKGPYCWLAMEYVEGESLTQVIHRIGVAGMLDWRNAFRVIVHLARALDYAHGKQIIHRNLTPQNVLIRADDKTTKLGDLMLAKAMEGELAAQLTKPGEVLGVVRYMSPERAIGGPTHCDGRSDLYSLGALVYAVLTGKPPFEGESLVETLTLLRQAKPEPPKKVQLAIPDRFEAAVLKLLAKRPEQRFQTAQELLVELEATGKFLGVKA